MLISNAYWTVLPGKQAEAEAALTELAAEVYAQEPDTWMYLVHRPNRGFTSFPPQGEGAVTFMEIYKDYASFMNHVTGPVFNNFLNRHGALFLNMYGPTRPFMLTENLVPVSIFARAGAEAPTLYTVISRWSIRPGCEAEAKAALRAYIAEMLVGEPGTLLYSANTPDRRHDPNAFPAVSRRELVYNSGWADHQAFLDHGSGPIYQRFLTDHGHLFLQVNGQDSATQPYLTSIVLQRIAGFIRPRLIADTQPSYTQEERA